MVHDRHPVAKFLGLLHVVGGQQHGAPFRFELLDQLPHVPPGLRVQAGGGLVQEQQDRVVDQCGGNGEPLFLPAGKLLEEGLGAVGQFHLSQQAQGVNLPVVNTGHHVQYLGQVQPVEVGGRLELNADNLLNLPRVFLDVDAVDQGRSAVGGAHSLQYLDGGGLARAIGSQDAEDLSRTHGK